jgi:copper chaperone CopZ
MRAVSVIPFVLSLACGDTPPTTAELTVRGMVCSSCEQAIEQAVARLDGVLEVDADHAGEKLVVVFDPGTIDLVGIEAAVDRLGYDASPPEAR